jgi:hypothetical protein
LRAQGVQLLDVTDPIVPHLLGSVQVGGGSTRLLALSKDEKTLFVSRVFGPVEIVDVSDHSAPKELTTRALLTANQQRPATVRQDPLPYPKTERRFSSQPHGLA